jgi:hypothetical protein
MIQKLIVVMLVVVLSFILSSREGAWWMIQTTRSIFGRSFVSQKVDAMEIEIWDSWRKGIKKGTIAREDNLLALPTVYSLDEIVNLDLARPFVVKNISSSDILSLERMLSSPLGDIEIDYFSDARKDNTVPDSRGSLKSVVQKIVNGGVEKIGSQMIVETTPSILSQFVEENKWLVQLFGSSRTSNWQNKAVTVTVPVFVSRGRAPSGKSGAGNSLAHTTRTDLHCEPISNVVLQTVGSKTWTLIEPRYAHLLKPTVAPDGRAYFYSRLDPLDPASLYHVPRYEIVTEKGDILYVPTWTWHRVEYLPDIVAVSLSVFEFLPMDFVWNNPLFAVTLIPNLIKEAVGLKMQ